MQEAPKPTPQSPEEVLQIGMQPIQNAVNIYGQRQFDMNMQLEQQVFAAQQQQAQLQAQDETGYPAAITPNAFSQFYQDKVGASITNLSPYSGNTKIFTSSNTTNDIKELNRNGYWLIGVSAFQGPLQSQDAVMVQANKVGADVVLLSSAYLRSQQVTVVRFQYVAGFFRKIRPPIFGIIGIPLPSEIRQQLERNTGVFVWVVANDSPAFNANILEGDVILKMNGEDVMSVADLTKKNVMFAGQKIDVEIWRNGQFKTISVQLNDQSGVSPVPSPSDAPPQSSAWDDYVKLHHEWARTAATTPSADPQDKPLPPIPAVMTDEYANAALARLFPTNGNAAAQRFKGIYYLGGSGDGTPNYVEAAKWFRKAADQNDVFSELCLGDLYADGNGVPRDYIEALKWYRKAADQGNAVAQYNLGCYYEFGKGVAKDVVEAAKWFRKAADQGNAAAQYSLGYCYCNGQGIEADAVEGYKWCNLASAQGIEPAKKILTILEQKITPEQIAEAQRLSMAFQPHMESAATNSN